MIAHNNISAIELYERLQLAHPDKMLIDDINAFDRGKLAGHIEIILEIERILFTKEDEIEVEIDGY